MLDLLEFSKLIMWNYILKYLSKSVTLVNSNGLFNGSFVNKVFTLHTHTQSY